MRSRLPVLFVDFDGVIAENTDDPERSAASRLIPGALRRLERIVACARPRVVVSSTWRIMRDPPRGVPPYDPVVTLNTWLAHAGCSVEVEGVTPVHARCETVEDVERVRGGEIRAWLVKHAEPGTTWAVLDDFKLEGVDRLVLVEGGQLSDEDVEAALDLLRPLGEGEVTLLQVIASTTGLLRVLRAMIGMEGLVRLVPGLVERGLLRAYGRGRNRSYALTAAGYALLP